MIPKDGINLPYLKAALARRFWYIVLPFFLISTGTVIYCIRVPRLYKSTALILVQPQEIPTSFVTPTVSSDVAVRLRNIIEEVMSRSGLESIIEKHGLLGETRPVEGLTDAVEMMRQRISIDLASNASSRARRGNPSSFQVSFEGSEPQKVRDVTESIVNLFIDHNLRLRTEQAAGTSRFLQRELERMRDVLRQKEENLRQFKQQHMGRLPEQAENNHRIMAQLQQHLNTVIMTLQRAEDRKVLLQDQLNEIESLKTTDEGGTLPDESELSLSELRQQLESLKLRYSDKHPDVARLSAIIAKREQGLSEEDGDRTAEEPTASIRRSGSRGLMDLQGDQARNQLESVIKEIESLQKEKKQVSQQIEDYRKRIEETPKIEVMLVDLRRDYDQANSTYQSLLNKRMQADLAENLERTEKGEQFHILDHANLPHKPFKPDVQRLLVLGFMIALGCGLGLAFLRESLDSSFYNGKELEDKLQIPVLVSVPVIMTQRDRRRIKFKRYLSATAVFSMASMLMYALYFLWKMDPMLHTTPLG